MKKRVYVRKPDGNFGYWVLTDDKLFHCGREYTIEEFNRAGFVAVVVDPQFRRFLKAKGLNVVSDRAGTKITTVAISTTNNDEIRANLHDLTVVYPYVYEFGSMSALINLLIGAVNIDHQTFGELVYLANEAGLDGESVLAEAMAEKLEKIKAPEKESKA